jgi:hypothetical protein
MGARVARPLPAAPDPPGDLTAVPADSGALEDDPAT